MPKINEPSLREVQDALEQYRLIVEATRMSPDTKRTYLLHTKNFVRWLSDDFNPGANVRQR